MRSTLDVESVYFDRFSRHFKQNLDMKWALVGVGVGVGAIPGLLSSCAGLVLWWQVGLTWLAIGSLVGLSVAFLMILPPLGIALSIVTLIASYASCTVFPAAAQSAMLGIVAPLLIIPEGLVLAAVVVPIVNALSPIFVLAGSYGVLAPQIPSGLFLTATGLYNPATAVMTLGQGACLMDAICLMGGLALGALAVVLYQTVDSLRNM